MFKRILMAIILSLGVSSLAFADMTDKATLGGMSTTNGVYDWRVDSNGNLIPGTTNTNNVGSSTNQVSNVYASTVNIGNLFAAGSANGGSTSMATTATIVPLTYSIVEMNAGNSAAFVQNLANGYPGQILTLWSVAKTSSDTLVITPATSTGFSTATISTAKQSVTLLFVNNTIGWTVIGVNGATIS